MLKYLPGGSRVPAPQGGRKVSSSPSVPDVLVRWIGEDANQEGVRLLFEGLQQPLLNKQVRGGKGGEDGEGEGGGRRGGASWTHRRSSPQMTYVLLDVAVQELFPELSKVINCLHANMAGCPGYHSYLSCCWRALLPESH